MPGLVGGALRQRSAPNGRRLVLLLLGWLLVGLQSLQAAWAEPPAAALFFQDAVMSQAQLSPDGLRVAFLIGAPGKPAELAVLDLATRKPTVVAAFADLPVGHFRWVNSRRLVLSLTPDLVGPGFVNFAPGLFAVDADGGSFRQLVETRGAFVRQPDLGVEPLHWRTRLDDARAGDGDWVHVSAPGEVSRERVGYFGLQRLNTRTGRSVEVESPPHAVDWLTDAHGVPQWVLTRQAPVVKVMRRDRAGGGWVVVSEHDELAGPSLPRWLGADGRLYGVAAWNGHDALFTLDASTGRAQGKPLLATPGFDVRPGFILRQGRLAGVRHRVDAEVTTWFDADAKALQATLDAKLPATTNRLSLPEHGDSPYALVQAFSDQQPTLTLLLDTRSQQLIHLGSSHPGIQPKAMGQTDFVRIRAGDGLDIPSYLTLPPGITDAKGRKLPMVVLVHGGPWVRGAWWHWQAEVQFLATRGYAVLQPEFRGSTGYGHAHFRAGWKQWGRAMQTDLADATRWAIAQGIADPGRIAIAGASYGGYAALMGLVQNPELFRCGINWVGVTDPGLMFSVHWSDITEESRRFGMARLIGDPVADAEAFTAVSPLAQAARITQPLLMAYGDWDRRVPIVHGEKLRDALKPHNPAVEWVVYPDEGHGWRKLANQVDFWGRVERFLARELAARPVAP